MVFMHFFI
jgi:hypothetical protein